MFVELLFDSQQTPSSCIITGYAARSHSAKLHKLTCIIASQPNAGSYDYSHSIKPAILSLNFPKIYLACSLVYFLAVFSNSFGLSRSCCATISSRG